MWPFKAKTVEPVKTLMAEWDAQLAVEKAKYRAGLAKYRLTDVCCKCNQRTTLDHARHSSIYFSFSPYSPSFADHLVITCPRCQKQWRMRCADAEEENHVA